MAENLEKKRQAEALAGEEMKSTMAIFQHATFSEG
jgi:hypothetical protein